MSHPYYFLDESSLFKRRNALDSDGNVNITEHIINLIDEYAPTGGGGGGGNTSVMTVNPNGTVTHDDGTGDLTVFQTGWTTVTDNMDGTATFTYPSGTPVVLTLGDVTSVNSQTGAVVLNTDNINEGATNLYYTDARVSANVDVSANSTARHTHANKAVLDLLTDAGSGAVITALERSKLSAIEDNAKNNTVSNLGAGTGVFKQQVGSDFELRSIGGTGVISVGLVGDLIQISSSAEENTASNVGSGVGIFKQKSGADLELRSINAADSKLTVSLDGTDDIDIGFGSVAIDDLSDVDDSGKVNGYVLTYNNVSGNWEAQMNPGAVVTAAYGTITDGTTPANASGTDTFRLRSNDSSVTITTQNDDGTFGDNANFVVNQSAINSSDINNNAGFISGVAWGDIIGTLSNQTDLQSALDAKSDTGHTHAASVITYSNVGSGLSASNVQAAIDELATDSHTHANKAVLDGISAGDITNWDAAFGWGDHSAAGYMTGLVVEDNGSVIGTRSRLNFIEGNAITLTIADDVGNNEVDITVAVDEAAIDNANITNGANYITQSYFDSNLAGTTNTTPFTPTLDHHPATKAWVESQIAAATGIENISEADDTDITSPSSGQLLIWDGADSWNNRSMSGGATINSTGVVTLTNTSVTGQLLTGLSVASGGAITGTDTIRQAFGKTAHDLTDLITLSGMSRGSTNLSSFTGTTIPDGRTIKQALQDLETAVEAAAGGGITAAYSFMTDGTTTSTASGSDTFKFRSANNAVSLVVTNDDATHNDNLLLTFNVGNVDHDSLSGFVSNEHIDHSGITITAGSGLDGGGDLTASRTINITDTGVAAASYGAANTVPTFTVNSRGQLTTAADALISITESQISDLGNYSTVGHTHTLANITDVTATAAELNLLDLSGLTVGHVLRATGASTAAWGQLNTSDLNNDLGFTTNSTLTSLTDTDVSGLASGDILVYDGVNSFDNVVMSGDATIAASGALTLKNTGTAGTYGTSTIMPVFTTDAQGRVTNVTLTATTRIGSVEADTGSALPTGSGTTLVIAGGDAINTAATFIGDRTVTANLDFGKQSVLGSADSAADYLLILDATDSTLKRVLPDDLGITTGITSVGYSDFDEDHLRYSMSSGIITGGELSINGSNTTQFDISSGTGIILDTWTTPGTPIVSTVSLGSTGVATTNLATASASFILVDSSGTVVQQTTPPTIEQRRTHLVIGQLGHSDNTNISVAVSQPNILDDPAATIRDLAYAIGTINLGVTVVPNGTNLNLDRTAGDLYKYGANFYTDRQDPSHVTISSATTLSFRMRTQTGNGGAPTTTLDVGNYDNAGTITALANNKYTNMRVYQLSSGNTVIQYGQNIYNSMNAALEAKETEDFVELSNVTEGVLIGVISVKSNGTDLSNTSDAIFSPVSKFGDVSAATTSGGDHSLLTNLIADDHTQYMLLAGRSGGQTLIGGIDAGNNLVFQTTSNASKGQYRFSELSTNGFVKTTGGTGALSVSSSVNLASEVNGNLPVANLNGGTGASSTTFWRGDNQWATPAYPFNNFLVGSDSGVNQTFNDGDLLDVVGGTGITGTVSKASTTATISLTLDDTAVTPGTYGNGSQTPTITIDQQGRITSASNTSIFILSSQVSDLEETIEDITGNNIVSSDTTISRSYDDLTGLIDLTVNPSSVDHNSLNNLTTGDPHTQYSLIASGAGAPATTPSRVGLIYVDTTADDIYISDDTTGSGDWQNLSLTGISTIAAATDTDVSGPVSGELLIYDGTDSWDNVAMSGDATINSAGALTLANSGVTNGSYGSTSAIPTFTVDAKGRLTAAGTAALNSSNVTEGSNLYFTNARVRSTTLTGLSVAVGGTITGSDTVLSAFGKLQNQITNFSGGANELSDLSDVNTSTPTNRNVLVADGTDWESRALVEADISDFGTYLTGNETITLSGDVTGSGTTAITTTLANSGVTAGNYGSTSQSLNITVDAKGRVTAITPASILITKSQLVSFDEEVQDVVGALITSSTGTLSTNYIDGSNLFDINLDHLGIEDLVDPNADRIMFWDDSAGAMEWLTLGTNLSITGTTLNATDTGISNVVEDATPQLGGNLDLNGNTLTGSGVTNRVTYWDGSGNLSNSADLTYDGSELTLGNDFNMSGSTSGTLTIAAPAVVGTNTVTWPAATGTIALIDDTAYGAGWNGDVTFAPTKNAVYDRLEVLATEIFNNTLALSATNGSNFGTFTGSTLTDNSNSKALFQELETAFEARTTLYEGSGALTGATTIDMTAGNLVLDGDLSGDGDFIVNAILDQQFTLSNITTSLDSNGNQILATTSNSSNSNSTYLQVNDGTASLNAIDAASLPTINNALVSASAGSSNPTYTIRAGNTVSGSSAYTAITGARESMSLILTGDSSEVARIDLTTDSTDARVEFSGNSIKLPNNPTAGRPATPENGDLHYNTTTNKGEIYENGSWVDVGGGSTATGGYDTIAGERNGGASGTQWFAIGNGASDETSVTIGYDGTVVNLGISTTANSTITVELYINGVASGSTVSLSSSQNNNVTVSESLAAGDRIGFRVSSGSTANTTVVTATIRSGSVPDELVNDTTPQLGGDLDLNGFDITGLIKPLSAVVVAPGSDVDTTGDGQVYIMIPSGITGNITKVSARFETVGSGTTGVTTLQVARNRSGSYVDVLSTALTIDANELTSDTAATAAVINTSNDDVQEFDILRVDLDAVASGGTLGTGLLIGIEITQT